jgi:hypothetical protein
MTGVDFKVKQRCEVCRNVTLAGHLLCASRAEPIQRLMNTNDDIDLYDEMKFSVSTKYVSAGATSLEIQGMHAA